MCGPIVGFAVLVTGEKQEGLALLRLDLDVDVFEAGRPTHLAVVQVDEKRGEAVPCSRTKRTNEDEDDEDEGIRMRRIRMKTRACQMKETRQRPYCVSWRQRQARA